MRLALGIAYRGGSYLGWQSQTGGRTVQDEVQTALAQFVGAPISVACAGRTDAGVHAINQVVHLDAAVEREPFSWVRGTNRFLPRDIAVQWCRAAPPDFHARNHARGRRYSYVLLQSAVRPSIDAGLVGWTFRALDGDAMRAAAQQLIGTHDFSAFRAADCQAASPVKEMRSIAIAQRGAYWRFDFDASAFLHHMVRNIMGCLIEVGTARRAPPWIGEVLRGRDRSAAAPTFAAAGLYFAGPYYDAALGLPEQSPALDWLPR